jgi:hypothetical protein
MNPTIFGSLALILGSNLLLDLFLILINLNSIKAIFKLYLCKNYSELDCCI